MTRQLDARHHVTLIDDHYREQLARIDGEIIPAYVSWALRIQMYRRYAVLAGERAKADYKGRAAEWTGYQIKLEKAAEYLQAAWARNLDMSIADKGQGRKEVLVAVQSERGGLLPAESGGRQQSQPVGAQVVVNTGSNGGKPAAKPGFLQALRPQK